MKLDTECADDIPTSVLVLHSLADYNQDEDTETWHDLIKDNPFAQSEDNQMTSEKYAKRMVNLGPNS